MNVCAGLVHTERFGQARKLCPGDGLAVGNGSDALDGER